MSDPERADDPFKVLFVCTGNSARSIMAEAILNKIGRPRVRAHSAGSHPKGAVHPETVRLLESLGYNTSRLRSKSWNEFSDSARFDLIVTVCNNAAGEVCPAIAGKPAKMHWDIPDPSAASGPQSQREAAFRQTHDMLLHRIRALVREVGREGAALHE